MLPGNEVRNTIDRIKVWCILADIYRHGTNTEMALIRMGWLCNKYMCQVIGVHSHHEGLTNQSCTISTCLMFSSFLHKLCLKNILISPCVAYVATVTTNLLVTVAHVCRPRCHLSVALQRHLCPPKWPDSHPQAAAEITETFASPVQWNKL